MDIIALLQALPGVGPYLPYILVVFGICAVLAAQLPPPRQSGSTYDVIYRVVNLLGQNYRQARNVSAPSRSAVPPSSFSAVLFLSALTCALSACANGSTNPAADVAALEVGLTAAETAATAYAKLPACTGTNGPLCSTSTIVTQMKTADAQAYVLVKAAEQAAGNPSALSAAQAAVTVLTSITSVLPKQGN
jgi:hypothetical protein